MPAHAADADTSPPGRGPLYIIGGVLLALILVGFWFAEDLQFLFERTPVASDLEGTWVFDAERSRHQLHQIYGNDQQLPAMEKSYGRMMFTFAPGSIVMDNGSGTAEPVPCKVQGFPPDGYLVSIGEDKALREFGFQLLRQDGSTTLYMSTEGGMVPFKRKD